MSYIVSGISPEPFRRLFGLSDEALTAEGAVRYAVDAPVGYPCRITLEDAPVGETVLLVNYEHLPVDTPYRSRHAIFVREGDHPAARVVDRVPPALAVRQAISLRAFDASGMMVDAEIAPGAELEPIIERMFGQPNVAYLHAHNAGRGCFAARIDRS